MQISVLLIEQILELFLMLAMGFLIVKIRLLKSGDSAVLSKILLYLCLPCVIISAFQVSYAPEKLHGLLLAFLTAVLLQAVLLLVTYLLKRAFHLNTVEETSIYYSNAGNLIIPIVTFVLGKEWVLYACAFMSVQLFFIWTHGKSIISGEKGFHWKKIVFNTNIIAIVIGAALFFAHIQLPKILGDTVASIGNMIGPLSMVVSGMLIAAADLKALFRNGRLYGVTALRLLVLPACALLLLKVSGLASLHPKGSMLLLVSFLALSTPSASTVTQMAQVYGGNAQYASAINVMSTLFCIVTMPVMVGLYQAIGI